MGGGLFFHILHIYKHFRRALSFLLFGLCIDIHLPNGPFEYFGKGKNKLLQYFPGYTSSGKTPWSPTVHSASRLKQLAFGEKRPKNPCDVFIILLKNISSDFPSKFIGKHARKTAP